MKIKQITAVLLSALMLVGCVNANKKKTNNIVQAPSNEKYKGNLEIVIADVKQAQIHNKLKDTTQVNHLLDGFEKMQVDGVRITIFGEEVNPNPKMYDYLYHEAKARGFKIFANPALWEGARRIVNRINKGKNTGQKVLGDDQATDLLVERILKFSKEYPVDWICPFNEDGQPGQYWTASQINETYQRLAENNIEAQLIGPCTWGVGSGTKILNKTDIKDYISVATTHNLGFEHNKWSKFLKSAKGLKVWDSETNMNKKFKDKDIRIEAAIKAGVNGLVLYDSWKGIDLTTGNLNAVGEQWVEKYLEKEVKVSKI
ncbi:hypothetical protein [Flammeovirga sp. EKP202]|uniref:hypothetical protein n=1 Tax=Flammeovirga sp. EKP202 TaxID=2770592 RepID=UPI00166004F2|nr:hypothetical protein [Flammeovirga sp. EKP202]MBD0404606.1 hypothetical protein [Flammeovirga sp. EKP202]